MFFINLITTLNYYTAIDYFRLQNKSPTEIYMFRLSVCRKAIKNVTFTSHMINGTFAFHYNRDKKWVVKC